MSFSAVEVEKPNYPEEKLCREFQATKCIYSLSTWVTAAGASCAPALASADDDEADDQADDEHQHPEAAELRRGEADRVEKANLN